MPRWLVRTLPVRPRQTLEWRAQARRRGRGSSRPAGPVTGAPSPRCGAGLAPVPPTGLAFRLRPELWPSHCHRYSDSHERSKDFRAVRAVRGAAADQPQGALLHGHGAAHDRGQRRVQTLRPVLGLVRDVGGCGGGRSGFQQHSVLHRVRVQGLAERRGREPVPRPRRPGRPGSSRLCGKRPISSTRRRGQGLPPACFTDLRKQLQRQAQLLSIMADGVGTRPSVYQVALLPAGLCMPERIDETPVLTWERVANTFRDVAPPYWIGVLDEALNRYDDLVYKTSGRNYDTTITGQEIYINYNDGNTTYTWMGRNLGLHGSEIHSDLETRKWMTFKYKVRRDPLPDNRNWFPIADFIKKVDFYHRIVGSSQ